MSAWIKDGVAFCPCCNNNYDTNSYIPFTPEQAAMYAAAPELLAALKKVAAMHCRPTKPRTYVDHTNAMQEALAAIAKATGKPA